MSRYDKRRARFGLYGTPMVEPYARLALDPRWLHSLAAAVDQAAAALAREIARLERLP